VPRDGSVQRDGVKSNADKRGEGAHALIEKRESVCVVFYYILLLKRLFEGDDMGEECKKSF